MTSNCTKFKRNSGGLIRFFDASLAMMNKESRQLKYFKKKLLNIYNCGLLSFILSNKIVHIY